MSLAVRCLPGQGHSGPEHGGEGPSLVGWRTEGKLTGGLVPSSWNRPVLGGAVSAGSMRPQLWRHQNPEGKRWGSHTRVGSSFPFLFFSFKFFYGDIG